MEFRNINGQVVATVIWGGTVNSTGQMGRPGLNRTSVGWGNSFTEYAKCPYCGFGQNILTRGPMCKACGGDILNKDVR